MTHMFYDLLQAVQYQRWVQSQGFEATLTLELDSGEACYCVSVVELLAA